MRESQQKVARECILLANCDEAVATDILKRSVVRRFQRGEMLFDHGDEAHSVFIVLDGWVKLFRITPVGTEAVVGVFTRGKSFGEAVAFRRATYPVAAEAATDCEVVQVRAAEMLALMKSHPDVCIAILSSTFAHLHALVSEVEQLKAHSGAQRVAQFLLSLAPVAEGACTVTLPYDKILIAGRIGMKPESLSRAFARLRDVGVHVRNTSAAIDDVAKLAAFAEADTAMPSRAAP